MKLPILTFFLFLRILSSRSWSAWPGVFDHQSFNWEEKGLSWSHLIQSYPHSCVADRDDNEGYEVPGDNILYTFITICVIYRGDFSALKFIWQETCETPLVILNLFHCPIVNLANQQWWLLLDRDEEESHKKRNYNVNNDNYTRQRRGGCSKSRKQFQKQKQKMKKIMMTITMIVTRQRRGGCSRSRKVEIRCCALPPPHQPCCFIIIIII